MELDLNGFDITSTGVVQSTNVLGDTLYVCDVFVVSGYNTTFTIIGSGTVSANPSEEALEGVNEDDLSVCVLSALDGAYVKIDGGGVYHSTGCTVIYARTESRVDIFDGGFIADEDWYGTYYTLDVWEGEHSDLSSARINVYGGIFVEFNPANHSNDGGYTSKVVELYAHVVEIEDEEFGTVYVVERHDGNNGADFTQPLCSVCGVCVNIRFHFVNGDKVYLFEKGDNHSEYANALIFTLEAVEGEDEVFYVYDNYSKAYLIYAGNDELALSKDKSQNAKWHIYTNLTDDFYNIYFIGVGFDYELVIENDFYFLSYCKEHDLQLDSIDATCTTDGGTTYSCEHCGLYDIDVNSPATGHSYDDGVVTNPTCTEDGYTTYTCHCGDYYTEKGDPATGHSYDAGVVTDPTCTEDGYTTYTCHCGYYYTEKGDPALGHEFLYLGGGGTHWVECDRCDYLDKDEPCFGGKADCENGAICEGCRQEYGEALGHDYPDTWTNNGENHIKVCGNDPSHILTKAHYIEKIIGENATCTEPGSVKKVCICGAIIEEIIEDPIGHDFTSYVNNCDGTHSATCNRGDCRITVAEKHSLSSEDSIYCECGALMFEKAYSVGVNDVIILVVEDGDNLNAMTSSCFTSTTSAAHLTIVPADVDGYYYLMSEGYYFTRRSPGGSRIQMTPAADELSRWIITILEDGTAVLLNDGDQLSIDDGGNGFEFGFNVPTNDLTISIYKLKDEDSFDHTWSKYIPNGDDLTHTRTCSTCGLQETNDHDWSDWSRGDATNAQHSRECSSCSKVETEVCSIDENQRIGYMVSDGVNGKLIAAQYICTICNQPANKVCDEEIIPVANEAELRAAISAGRSVIFEANIEVTSTINVDCDLVGNVSFDLAGHKLGAYNCALFYIYDSTGQGMGMSVTITGEGEIYTRADDMNTCCPIAFVSNQVELKIMSGTFVNRANSELFILREQGIMSVYGGTFMVAYDGYTGAEEAHCANHNGVIDLVDESGVEFEGNATFYCAELIGWDFVLSVDSSTNLRIGNGSHIVGGHDEYIIEYCQYDAGVVTEPGCCRAKGYTTYTCKVCGGSYIDDYTSPIDCVEVWIDNGDGTCSYGCNLPCGNDRGECIAPWSEGPYPHEDMNNDYVCDNCGAHIHKYESIITPPSCFEEGYTTYTCLCGDSYVADIVDAYGGHEFDIVIVAPTCTEMGYTHHSCSYCGEEFKTDEVPALGHDWIWTSADENTCSAVCSRDNSHTTSGEHVDSDTEDGKCDNCGATIKVVAEPITATTTIANIASENDWSNGLKYGTFVLDSIITISSSGKTYTGNYYESTYDYRLYQSEGAKFTIGIEDGYQIISVKITYTPYNSGCLLYGGSTVSSGSEVDVNDTSITFDIGNTGTATNGQARVTAIEVVYLAVNPCDHNYVGEVTDPTCTDKGYTTYTCSYCGKSYVDNEVDALGHELQYSAGTDNHIESCENCDYSAEKSHIDANSDGLCDKCEATISGEITPSKPKTYTFSAYEAGTQYAGDEVHKLDDNTTITTTDCHFTTQLRIYSSNSNNGYAVIHSQEAVKSISVNAGYKVDTINVYGSDDEGATWELIGTISVEKTTYKDYTLDLGGSYNYIKLDVAGTNQIRVASLTLNF